MTPKVLIVDDSETVRRHVVDTLQPEGFHVLTAHDGPSGIALLKATPDLSLVILDLNMPGMSGIGVLEWMRADGSAHLPPALMMTTELSPKEVERAKQAGARGWLVKPVAPKNLLAIARKLAVRREPQNGD